jgi:calcium-dependent protein kinase
LDGRVGTHFFIAPEVIDRRSQYGAKCDVWSIGVMLCIVLTGDHPFVEKAPRLSHRRLFKAVINNPLRQELLAICEDGAAKLISSLLVRDPDKRLSAKDALHDGWLTGDDEKSRCGGAWMMRKVTTKEKDVVQSAVVRAKAFTTLQRFQKALLTLIVHRTESKEVDALKDVFMCMDTKSNGVLTQAEIKTGLKSCKVNMSDEDIEYLFRSLDTNKSGSISYTEWLTATLRPSAVLSEKAIRDIFNMLDSDRSGTISRSELFQIMGESSAASALLEGDVNQDDCLTFEEFKMLLDNISDQPRSEAKTFIRQIT